MADCFDLLGIAPAWRLEDVAGLREAFLARQERAGEAQQRELNRAWAALRSPVGRARALLARLGRRPPEESTAPADKGFLEALLELRAALEAARQLADVERVQERVRGLQAEADAAFAGAWDAADADAGEAVYYRLQFLDRIGDACLERQDEIQGI